MSVTVQIENTYECGRESTEVHELDEPGPDLQSWWDEVVYPLVGDGHSCGGTENGISEAIVIEAEAVPELVGESYSWEG